MRILLVHSFWHPRGGDTTSLQIQRQVLSARGHDIVPFGTRHPDNLPEPGDSFWPGWREKQLRPGAALGAMWSRSAAVALRALLARQPRFDVAHIHHLHRHLTPSILPVLRRAGIPIVWTLHDYELTCPTAHHYRAGAPCFDCATVGLLAGVRHGCSRATSARVGQGLGAAATALEKAVHRGARVFDDVTAFITPSRYLQARVAPVVRGRLVHLPNPVRVDGPPGGAPGTRSGVLYAGRMVEEKGVLDVVAIARALPTVRFRVLGDGPLRAAVRRSGLANLECPGEVSGEAVREELRRAAVVLVPSRWPENDPYAVTEAQAAGAAVIASGIGGIPEQIEHGVDGILCPPARPADWVGPLSALLADPARARQIGVRAHERVARERNPDAFAIALEAVYRSSG